MLDNTITLPVDVAGNGTFVDKVYTRDEEYLNRAVYTGPGHTLSLRNTLSTYRTKPKKSGNFNGVGKAEFKFTQDYVVPGVDLSTSLVAATLIDVSTSFPVGISAANAMDMRQRAIAFLDHQIAIALTEQLQA